MFSPRSVRRNVQKLEASHQGLLDGIKALLPSIIEKMTWGTNEKILDHGYNSGKKAFEILAPLAEKTDSTVYILDNCPHTIEHAQTNYSHGKVEYILGDMNVCAGTLGELKFNKIFSFYGLYYSTDYKIAVKNMYDHLLPGGEAFFMIPTEADAYETDKAIVAHPEWSQFAEGIFTVHDYTEKEGSGKLKKAFEDAGFEIKEFNEIKLLHTFKNMKEAADAQASLNPFMLLLPKKEHDELEAFYYDSHVNRKTDTYTPGLDSPDDEYTYPYTVVQVLVKKPE